MSNTQLARAFNPQCPVLPIQRKYYYPNAGTKRATEYSYNPCTNYVLDACNMVLVTGGLRGLYPQNRTEAIHLIVLWRGKCPHVP